MEDHRDLFHPRNLSISFICSFITTSIKLSRAIRARRSKRSFESISIARSDLEIREHKISQSVVSALLSLFFLLFLFSLILYFFLYDFLCLLCDSHQTRFKIFNLFFIQLSEIMLYIIFTIMLLGFFRAINPYFSLSLSCFLSFSLILLYIFYIFLHDFFTFLYPFY